jgi:hypothetical protein
VDVKLGDENFALARSNAVATQNRSHGRTAPKKPLSLAGRFTSDDGHVIAHYVDLLEPCKRATIRLQVHVKLTGKGDKPVKGAIWQVLHFFEDIMTSFENARNVTGLMLEPVQRTRHLFIS